MERNYDFEKEVMAFFKLDRGLLKNSTSYWKSLLSFLRKNEERIYQCDRYFSILLSQRIISRLLQLRCDDRSTVDRIIYFYLKWCRSVFVVFKRQILYVPPVEDAPPPVNASRLAYTALRNGDVPLFTVFLKYGTNLNEALCGREKELGLAQLIMLKFCYYADDLGWLPEDFFIEEGWRSVRNLMDRFKSPSSIEKKNEGVKFFRGLKRMFFIVRLLLVLMREDRKIDNYDRARCFQLYFRLIPDPFISVDEFLEFIRTLFNRQLTAEGENNLVRTYKTLLRFESSVPFQPRTLQHLCRCSVRKALSHGSQSNTLPILLKNIHFPKILKDFILGVDLYS